MNRRSSCSLLFLFFLITSMLVSGCVKEPENTSPVLRIGLLIYDQLESDTRPMVRAAHMAVDEVNATGGLAMTDGQRAKVELFVRTGFESPEQAVDSLRQLIYQDKIAALIGPSLSRNAIPAAEVVERVGIPMISPGSTHPDTTAGKRWSFRMPVVDDAQGSALARFALDDLGARTAAVLFNEAEPFSRNLGEVFETAFSANGGIVVASESYTFGDSDYDTQLARVAEQQPSVLFLPSPSLESAVQAKAARRLGLEATFLGCDGWTVAKMAAEPELEGSFVFQHWHPDLAATRPEAARLVKLYEEKFATKPNDVAALSWDAAGLLLEAARHGLDPEGIRDRLADMAGYRGATGVITFAGHGGDPPKSAVIVRLGEEGAALFEELDAPLGPSPSSVASD